MEASALQAPARLSRLPLAAPLLRLRSDDQLVALFRAGSDEAFGVLHDRYRQRLFAYVRQMLSGHSRQDAEDVLQDVFVRAFGALRNDKREINVRAWLYRVAHNRCIDHLRRPHPPASEIFEMSRKPLLDPVDEAQRREDLKRLVADVGRLPAQQRSALLMREIDGLSYADLAGALDVTVPAVKSLLVRARVGLVEAQESRDADCGEIQRDLLASYDRGVKASGRARRHMRECHACRDVPPGPARRAAPVRRPQPGRRRPAGARRQAARRRRCGRRGRDRRRRARRRRRAPRRPARSPPPSSAPPRSPPAARSRSTSSRRTRRRSASARRRRRAPRRARPPPRTTRPRVRPWPRRPCIRRPPTRSPRPGPSPRRRPPRAARRATAPADSEPLVAPPPDPAPYTGNAEPPVSVGAGPQVSSGGTAAPDDAPAADKAPVPDAAVGEAPDDARRPGRDAGSRRRRARAEPRPDGGRGARRSRGAAPPAAP